MTADVPWSARQDGSSTAVERIARDLALEILRGERAPDSRLPSLRSLAPALGVTVPTLQRVLERLEAQGLVTVRHGSGVVVRDPARHGELSLVPLWLEAVSGDPRRAGDMLAELLFLRRMVAGRLLEEAGPGVFDALPRLGGVVGALLTADTLTRRVELDLAFTRTLLEGIGGLAPLAVFRTVERLVREVPWVAEALYGDAEAHRRALAGVAAALTEAPAVEAALRAWDEGAVERFRELLSRR